MSNQGKTSLFKDAREISSNAIRQVLVRMWRKRNPHVLLVGMQTGVATVEDSMEFPQKVKNAPNWFGSVDRALACGLKGPGFDSSQGHVPWLREHPQ